MLLVTSPMRQAALQFEGVDGAVEFYWGTTGRIRADGNPDRPLTAYTAEFETLEVLAYQR
jgi:hypothetical protein